MQKFEIKVEIFIVLKEKNVLFIYLSFLGKELIEVRKKSDFEMILQQLMGQNGDGIDENKENFRLIVNVLAKIYLTFGYDLFVDRSKIDPLFLFAHQTWLQEIHNHQESNDMQFLIKGWASILKKWLRMKGNDKRIYMQQINSNQLDEY